jgi:predicted amino acid dehydrogenase
VLQSSRDTPVRFGFVVHPLNRVQRVLLGVRSGDVRLATLGRSTRRSARLIAHLQLNSTNGPSANGALASITQLPNDLLDDQERGVQEVISAAQLCEANGAQVIGLGAVAAMIGGQGKSVARAVKTPITTGNATTIIAACETVELVLNRLNSRRRITLLGPPGPVANGIMHLLVTRGHRVAVVASTIPKPLLAEANALNAQGYGGVDFIGSAEEALGPNTLLVAASSTGGRLRLSDLPSGSVIVDVAEPLDIVPNCTKRRDVLVLDGDYIRTPTPLRGGFWRYVYGQITGQRRHIFACFAEPIIISVSGRTDLCSVGRKVSPEVIKALVPLLSHHGFWVDTLFESGKPITDRRLRSFRDHDG